MIANALDADGKFTAAQVSRKLKQLGLRVPQPKKLSSHLHLRDEEPDDMYDEGFNDADTLSSLRKRYVRIWLNKLFNQIYNILNLVPDLLFPRPHQASTYFIYLSLFNPTCTKYEDVGGNL